MQPEAGIALVEPDDVSILTRPGGRVQQLGEIDLSKLLSVSILTRPGGRVQLCA